MNIASLRLQNFRSYSDASWEFGEGVNIVVGPNASGKTNLLDSLVTLFGGSSFRSSDADLVMFNAPWARIDGWGDIGERVFKVELLSEKPSKTYDIDGSKFKRLTFSKTIPYVLFEPEQLRLLHGSPDGRREFIDNLAAKILPEFERSLNGYKRTLRQRNALLKSEHTPTHDHMFAWNVRLCELAGEIVRGRCEVIEMIMQNAQQDYRNLSTEEYELMVEYGSKIPIENYESAMLKMLESSLDLDRIRGFTGSGPHRDDIVFVLNKSDVSVSASRGEIRTLLLMLKMFEARTVEMVRGQKPILLLDDVFGELDGTRRRLLTIFLQKYQSFITTTDADIISKHFSQNCNIIALK